MPLAELVVKYVFVSISQLFEDFFLSRPVGFTVSCPTIDIVVSVVCNG